MKKLSRWMSSALAAATLVAPSLPAAEPSGTHSPAWLAQPLSLAEAVDIALRQNSSILKATSDLEAIYGVVIQNRAVALPRVRVTSNYETRDKAASETFPGAAADGDHNWATGIRVIQSIYEGGRVKSALRAAELTKEQAIYNHQTVIADVISAVRTAYDDTLLAAEQIVVQEASVNLLKKELEDTTRRYDAGTVPRFNVLRAEVELANARPRLIRARNAHRIAKSNLVNLLGYNLPPSVWEDIPLQLTGKLVAAPLEMALPDLLAKALASRTELAAVRKAEALRKEAITNAKAGYKPTVQVYAGYGGRSSNFSDDLMRTVSGWNIGGLLSWDVFDGKLTKGKIMEATALHRRAQEEFDDLGRRIELEVRTAYSSFVEAKEVLESQKRVVEQAEEALRLAGARADAGTGTQLDVLNAQTALTEARTTQIQSLHDYSVARTRLERAAGGLNPVSSSDRAVTR
jgi:outer membrane protein